MDVYDLCQYLRRALRPRLLLCDRSAEVVAAVINLTVPLDARSIYFLQFFPAPRNWLEP